jgi:hypothetical protein
MIKSQRLAAAASKVGLILASLIISLILIELAARFLKPPYPGGDELHRCDRLLGWKGNPNTSVTQNTDGYPHTVTWNSQGMHDRDYSFDKPDGVFRILVLGDSFVEAQQVEEIRTNHHVLEETLNARAPGNVKFEVISGAIRAWGPAQQLIYFRSIGQLYQPNLVVLLWLPANDLTNVLPYDRLTGAGGTNCYFPYFAICEGQFDPEPWFPAPGFAPTWKICSPTQKRVSSILNYLYHHSRLYQQLEPILARNSSRIDYANPFIPWLPQAADDEALQYAYQLTDQIIFHLSDEAKQIGAQTALVIVPFNVAVHGDVEASYAQSLEQTVKAETGLGVNPTLPNQNFTTLMQRRNLPVLDMHPIFVEAARAGGEALYWPVDPHWTVAGNRLAGETIARWLIEQKLVPVAEK